MYCKCLYFAAIKICGFVCVNLSLYLLSEFQTSLNSRLHQLQLIKHPQQKTAISTSIFPIFILHMKTSLALLAQAYLPLGHLGHAPSPFELRKISLMAKHATLQKLPEWKIEEIVANRRQIVRLKCTKFNFGWAHPKPHQGSLQRSPRPSSWI